MEDRYDEIYNYLEAGTFPDEMNRGQKQTLKRSAAKFKITDGKLVRNPNKRVIKTKEEAYQVFLSHHVGAHGGHTGVVKTRYGLCKSNYWPGMTKQSDNWVLSCDVCQRVGAPVVTQETLTNITVSDNWELAGMDLTGPLPLTKRGNRYILTVTDYHSKWVEAYPLQSKSATEIAANICDVCYHHGCPLRILTDQGREFVNKLNKKLCKILRIKHSVTAAYHPQTNGLDEMTNKNIKRALSKLKTKQQENWDLYLQATLFSLRSKRQWTIKQSPFMMLYGREARFPCDIPEDYSLDVFMASSLVGGNILF